MIKAIIFDIGGVIFDEANSFQYSDLAKDLDIEPEKFIQVKDRHLEIAKIGKITGEEFMGKVAKDLSLDRNYVLKKWSERYKTKVIDGKMIKLVKKLKKSYSVIALSNTNELHAKINYKRGVYSSFDKVFLSNEIKLAKPDKKIYLHVLKKLKLKPGECIFIDDKKENVNVAEELGINGVVFKDYKDLLKTLKKLRITLK